MRGWLLRWLRRQDASAFSPRQALSADAASAWRDAFAEAEFLASAPRRLQEAQTQMVNHLGRAYQAHERLGRQYGALLLGVVQAADLCEGLQRPASPAPDVEIAVAEGAGESLAAVQRALLDLLASHGIERWECRPGDGLIEGCEVVGVEARDDLPDGVVASLVAPGYRRLNGEVLRRARVTVNRAPRPAPGEEAGEKDAAPEAPPQ